MRKDKLTDKEKKQQQLLLEGVEEVFVDPANDKDSGMLQFTDDTHGGIDPLNIESHDWKKPATICNDISKQWKVTQFNCKKSGTHDSEFCVFCNGHTEVH